jgi:hypothetical protein
MFNTLFSVCPQLLNHVKLLGAHSKYHNIIQNECRTTTMDISINREAARDNVA